MKKLLSTVLALSASLFFGLLLTGCSYFDFVGGGTIVKTETSVVEKEVIVEVPTPVYLKSCACWNSANEDLNTDDILNTAHYSISALQEHFADKNGNIIDGSYIIKCTKCDWSCTYEGALHRNFKTEVEGDCKVGAYERTRCTACSLITKEKATTAEHKYNATPDKTTAATCVEKGSNLFKCTVCGHEKNEDIPVDSNNHSFSSTPSSTTPATCTKAGTQTFKCTRSGCKGTKTVNNPNAPAKHPSTTIVNVTELGSTFCTDGGYSIEKCTVCKEIVSQMKVEVGPGHTILMEEDKDDLTMIGWTLDKLPSDTEKGSLKGFCSVCRQTVSQELPAWSLEDYSYVYNCAAKVITYTLFADENGKLYTQKPTDKVVNEFVFKNENATTYHTLNNKLMTENRYPTSLKGIVELAEDKSTCLVDGKGYFICENELCKQPVEIITYTEHNYENAKVIAYEGQEPTCKDTGKGYALCTQCNTTRKEDITIKALGHTYHEVAYVPVVSYNPETGKFSASLNIPCSKCDHCDTSASIKITASKAPTCLSSGYATCEYKDYNGETKTKTIFLYTADGTNPEGHGHKQGTVEQWSRYDEETKYTHHYTGFICPYCGIQFITKEVIKDKDGNVVDTIEYLE